MLFGPSWGQEIVNRLPRHHAGSGERIDYYDWPEGRTLILTHSGIITI